MKTKCFLKIILIYMLILGCTGCNKKNDLGGWKQVNTASKCCATSEDGYYFVDNNNLSFFDFDSEKAVPLCSKSGCLHKNESCNAYIEQLSSMYYWNGKLYTLEWENFENYCITERKKDGTAVETILTLADDEIKKGNIYNCTMSIWSGNYLWYLGTVETGTSTNIEDDYYELYKNYKLYCFNMETGKEEVVLENEKGNVELLSADEDKLIYLEWRFPNSYIPIDDAYNILFREDSIREVYSYDLESKVCKKVLEIKGDEVTDVLGVISGQLIIFASNGNLSLVNLENGEKEVLCNKIEQAPVMLTDSLIQFRKDYTGANTVFYDLDVRKEIKCNLDMEKEFVSFISYADDKYFIHRYTEKIDEDTYTGEKSAFISKKDLEKGEPNYKDLYN